LADAHVDGEREHLGIAETASRAELVRRLVQGFGISLMAWRRARSHRP